MRFIKNLFILALLFAVLGGGAVVGFRAARGKSSPPESIRPNVAAASAAGIYVYAARLGTGDGSGGPVVLFDTGADPEGHSVDAALAGVRASRADVTDIFLTHGHGDHTAAAAAFPKAKIHLGSGDLALAEKKVPPDALAPKLLLKIIDAPAVTANAPLEGPASFDFGKTAPDGVPAPAAGGADAAAKAAAATSAKATAATTVKAIPVPGHTPGSYVFLYDGVLFAGDTMVYKQGRLDRPPKYFDSDTDAAKASLVALKKQLADSDVDVVCTGHGGCTPKGLGKNLLDDLISRLGA